MICPACGGPTKVIETRQAPKNRIHRRRGCTACGARFTTAEGRISEITQPKNRKA